jgi:hypothetical protein
MADHVDEPFENVEVLDCGQHQLDVNQIGINLVKETMGQGRSGVADPVVECAVVTRRASGLLEIEVSLIRNDSLAKMAEHLSLRSNFESAMENERLIHEEEHRDD